MDLVIPRWNLVCWLFGFPFWIGVAFAILVILGSPGIWIYVSFVRHGLVLHLRPGLGQHSRPEVGQHSRSQADHRRRISTGLTNEFSFRK